jgi:oligoribonuclease NrnB/cAMP/cGMP phosphodiesterase (DHH superfamily)
MEQPVNEEKRKTLCLHHNDTDGRAAAAVIRKALGKEVLLYEMDYGNMLPLEQVIIADEIIIVDFSLPKDEMLKLASYHSLTWIDHHKSSILEMKGVSDDWPGVRNTDEAACVLTWQYYFPDKSVPRAVTLIGDRDIWRWAEHETGAFNEGLYQQDTRPTNDKLWTPLLNGDPGILENIITKGKDLREARLRDIRRTVLNRGFSVTIEGNRTLVLNIRGSGDIGEQVRSLGYDMAYCYADNLHNGEITTYVSLYSKDVDVSIIANRFGGGGHPGAAGFHFKRGPSPFPAGLEVEFDSYE